VVILYKNAQKLAGWLKLPPLGQLTAAKDFKAMRHKGHKQYTLGVYSAFGQSCDAAYTVYTWKLRFSYHSHMHTDRWQIHPLTVVMSYCSVEHGLSGSRYIHGRYVIGLSERTCHISVTSLQSESISDQHRYGITRRWGTNISPPPSGRTPRHSPLKSTTRTYSSYLLTFDGYRALPPAIEATSATRLHKSVYRTIEQGCI